MLSGSSAESRLGASYCRMKELEGLEVPRGPQADLCVEKCCFMLSDRVNHFWQPGKLHLTPRGAVWILEWREAWPDVENVLSQRHRCLNLHA